MFTTTSGKVAVVASALHRHNSRLKYHGVNDDGAIIGRLATNVGIDAMCPLVADASGGGVLENSDVGV